MVKHRTADVDGLSVFYREAGDSDAPKLLLLGGFPASSHQFRNPIPALADRFHVVAPDYPGFGNSDMPEPSQSPQRAVTPTSVTCPTRSWSGLTRAISRSRTASTRSPGQSAASTRSESPRRWLHADRAAPAPGEQSLGPLGR